MFYHSPKDILSGQTIFTMRGNWRNSQSVSPCLTTVKYHQTHILALLIAPGLCPENTYPKQMRQAALALDHIIGLGYSPSQVRAIILVELE